MRLLHARDAGHRRGAAVARPCHANKIRDALSGNYCRCTGYQAIVDAIEAVIGRDGGKVMSAAPGSVGRSARGARRERLVGGRGRYTDDLETAGVAHVAFLRSPYAHARIAAIDVDGREGRGGVIAASPATSSRASASPGRRISRRCPGIALRRNTRWREGKLLAGRSCGRRRCGDRAQAEDRSSSSRSTGRNFRHSRRWRAPAAPAARPSQREGRQ